MWRKHFISIGEFSQYAGMLAAAIQPSSNSGNPRRSVSLLVARKPGGAASIDHLLFQQASKRPSLSSLQTTWLFPGYLALLACRRDFRSTEQPHFGNPYTCWLSENWRIIRIFTGQTRDIGFITLGDSRYQPSFATHSLNPVNILSYPTLAKISGQ